MILIDDIGFDVKLRGEHRSGSKSDLTDPFLFLPKDSLNAAEPPRLVIKASPGGGSRVDLTDVDDDEKKKKLSAGNSTEDRTWREHELVELFKKLEGIKNLIVKVQMMAEELLKKQTGSSEFQMQMKKASEASDLQRGAYRILEACDGDRRELERLMKKATEMRKRQVAGVVWDGENEELRSLMLGAADLEKKLLKAMEEVKRLDLKTDTLITRQKDLEEARRQKMLEAMEKNGALKELMKDADLLDNLLKELSEVKQDQLRAENLERKMRQMDPNSDEEDEIDTDELILQRIGVDTEAATEDILKTREAMQKLQDIMCFEPDPDIDPVSEAAALKQNIESARNGVEQLKKEMEDFKQRQKGRYDQLMKSKMGDDAFRREMEEEERRRREEEERRRREEEERRRREEEERRRKEAEEEAERRRREAAEKELADRLNAEAEKNRMAQMQEILTMLECDTEELEKMKGEVVVLVDRQKKIGKLRRKRRELYTIPEEEENEDEAELQGIISNTSRLFGLLMQNEKELRRIKEQVSEKDPVELMSDVETLHSDMTNLEKDLKEESETLQVLKEETEKCQFKHEKKLKETEKMLKADDANAGKRNEILKVILGQTEKLESLKGATLAMKEAQVGLGDILDQRRKIFDLGPDKEEAAETELRELEKKSYNLFADMLKNSGELAEMRDMLEATEPLEMLGRVEKVEESLTRMGRGLFELQQETAALKEKHESLLKSGLEAKEQTEETERAAKENTETLDRLKDEAGNASSRQRDLEKDLRRSSTDIDEEEKRRRLAELEALMKQKDDLAAIEQSLDATTEKMEEWKEFAWSEAEEAELAKYENISLNFLENFIVIKLGMETSAHWPIHPFHSTLSKTRPCWRSSCGVGRSHFV